MNKKLTFTLLASALLLAACDPNPTQSDLVHNFVSPSGAPSLALYTLFEDDTNYQTKSNPQLVSAELLGNNFNYVIFDSINGLRAIQNNDANFKLYGLLTGGNYFLAGIDKEEGAIPSESDYIVSFGQGLIPDIVYDYLYPDAPVDAYVSATADAASVLKDGLYQGNEVDFVFIAEPSLTSAMNDTAANTYGRVSIVANIKEEVETRTGMPGMPQAGLFVRYEGFYEEHQEEIDEYLSFIDVNIDNAIDNPEVVRDYLNQYDQEAVRMKFGYNANIVYALQQNGQNRFGLVRASERDAIDINEFLTILGQPTVDPSLIL